MKKFSFKLVWEALKDSFKGFSEDKLTKLSASLAYYTVFSLGPLLIVIIHLCSVFFGKAAVEGKIVSQLQSFVGPGVAEQIQTIIQNASITGSGIAYTIGIITLVIGATTVFAEMQDSMNSIWGVKARPRSGIMSLITSRLLSFGIIASLGFLLLVSLAVSAVVEGIGDRLSAAFPQVGFVLIYIINLLLTFIVISLLFAVIFKVLPDVEIAWKHALPGAIATTILFMIGKFAISFYISKSDAGSAYGAAGSMVILILWIYYSAIILYFGAEFTQSYACEKGVQIAPSKHAQWYNAPAISGSKAKQKIKGWASQTKEKQNLVSSPAPQRSIELQPPRLKKQKKKGTGIGTVLLGLALYYFNTAKKQAAHK
jgi:membrane protein